jgi:hypothetical protein
MFKNKILLVISALITISGCAKMPVFKANWNTKSGQVNQPKVGQFDSDARLEYNIFNDNSRLYISLSTANPVTQAKILRNGVKIYISTNGKKDKGTYLHFPDAQVKYNKPFNPGHDNNWQYRTKRLKQMTARIYKEAQWHQNGRTKIITPSKGQNNFELDLGADSNGYIIYKVGIPLTDIYTAGSKKISVVTVGVHIDGFKRPKSNNAHHGERGERGERGEAGERGEGGMRGGRYENGNMGQHSQLTEPVNIWFITRLANKAP